MLNRFVQSKTHSLVNLQRPARYRPLTLGFEALDERRCLTVDNAVPSIDLSSLLDVELVQTIHILDLTDDSRNQDIHNEASLINDNENSLNSTDGELPPLQPAIDPVFPPMSGIDYSGQGIASNADAGGADKLEMGSENNQNTSYWQTLAFVFGDYSNFGKLAGENFVRNSQPRSLDFSSPSLPNGQLSSNASVAGDGQPWHSNANRIERPAQVAPVPVLSLRSINLVTNNRSAHLHDISSAIAPSRVSILSRSHESSNLIQVATVKNSLATPIHFRSPTHAPSLLGRVFTDMRQSRNEVGSEVILKQSPNQRVARVQVLKIDQHDRRQSNREPQYSFQQVVVPTSSKQPMLRPTGATGHKTDLNLPKAQPNASSDSASARPSGARSRHVSYQVADLPQSDSTRPDSVVERHAASVHPDDFAGMSSEPLGESPVNDRPALAIAMSCIAPWLIGVVTKHRKTKDNLHR